MYKNDGCQKCSPLGFSSDSRVLPVQGNQKIIRIGGGAFPLPALKPLGGGLYQFCPNCAISWIAILGIVFVLWRYYHGRG